MNFCRLRNTDFDIACNLLLQDTAAKVRINLYDKFCFNTINYSHIKDMYIKSDTMAI